MTDDLLRSRIRDVPDFPKPGIVFKDITPLLADPAAFRQCCSMLAGEVERHRPSKLAAIESRGFIFGSSVAALLGIGFVPVRKPGKLPWKTTRHEYALEYGSDALELHVDAVAAGERVVIVDDVLATGGTAGAAKALLKSAGADVAAAAFVIELDFLNGRRQMGSTPVLSLIHY
jgi:adenine phosphoribosyltransferase